MERQIKAFCCELIILLLILKERFFAISHQNLINFYWNNLSNIYIFNPGQDYIKYNKNKYYFKLLHLIFKSFCIII